MINRKTKIVKDILKDKTVGIAGLGGLGSNAAISLVRAGVGNLILVDFDKVEQSNLNRQYYFIEQIGKFKTKALSENIKNIDPAVNIIVHNKRLKKGEMYQPFKQADVIIEALDDADFKTSFIEENLVNYPDKKIIGASGVTGYGNTDKIELEKLGNLFLVYDKNALPSEKGVLFAPKIALIANMQADIALKVLLGDNL